MSEVFFRPMMIQLSIVFLVAGFIAIVMIQSGLDKVFDYKGNLSWIKEQFSKTFLRSMIGIFLPMIMLSELASGLLCVFGVIQQLRGKGILLLESGFVLTGIVILVLLFGQRVSKQYVGAVSLTGYFIITLIGLLVLSIGR